jgi:hypothetical protein
MDSFQKIKRVLFYSFLAVFIVTFFTRNSYRGVSEIKPEVLVEPIQTKTSETETISFEKDDYQYELAPLYDYEINGLVVHRMDYTWFSIYKMDSVFPLDLCMMWGENVKNRTYQESFLKFSQDTRFCRYSWRGHLTFDANEVSNNHILVKDKALEKRLRSINAGDQLRIKGKLVNVFGENIGKPGKYDPETFKMGTSIRRNDADAGACEIIYLEDFEILKKGNPVSCLLFKISSWGLVILIFVAIITFFAEIYSLRRY